DSAAGDPDHGVAGLDRLADDNPIRMDGSDAGPYQIESVALANVVANHLGDLRDLSTRNIDSCGLRARIQSLADLAEKTGLDFLHRDVVDHRDRPRAYADHVVGVHRDAIDPDRVVLSERLRNQELGADAVGGNRESLFGRQFADIGEVSER